MKHNIEDLGRLLVAHAERLKTEHPTGRIGLAARRLIYDDVRALGFSDDFAREIVMEFYLSGDRAAPLIEGVAA